MSKKHFIAIAATIRRQIDAIASANYTTRDMHTSIDTLRVTAHNLCNVFADANPAFDRARFLTACGM